MGWGTLRLSVVVHVRPFDGLQTHTVVVEGIWPNDAFMAALIALEKQVHRKATIELDEYIHWGDYDGPAEAISPALALLQHPANRFSRTGLPRS